MREVSVCMVGLGTHGLDQIGQLQRNPKQWAIAGVVDTSIASYMRFKYHHPQLRVPYFRHLSEAFESVEPEVTLVSTHAPSHVGIAKEIVHNRFSECLLIEKPISNSVSEADSLIDFIRLQGWTGRIAVDFGRRCSELYNKARNIIASGELGPLVSIEYLRPCKLSMKGMHYIDLANWFMDAKPIRVSGELDEHSAVDKRGAFYFDPPGSMEVTYENGLTFRMDTRDRPENRPFGMRVRLEGGNLFIDDAESFLEIETPSKSVRNPSDKENDGYNWIENTLTALVHKKSNFVPCTLQEAVDALEIVVAAHCSHEKGGQPISLPLNGADRATTLRIA